MAGPVGSMDRRRDFGQGAVISAVDLIMGLGVYAGLDVIRVEGATGLHDTNYEGKAEACLRALRDHDFVYVHVGPATRPHTAASDSWRATSSCGRC